MEGRRQTKRGDIEYSWQPSGRQYTTDHAARLRLTAVRLQAMHERLFLNIRTLSGE
jgi:hypothetical protein